MNIIVEGPDGAGKSTLVALIANSLDWEIAVSPGPTQNERDFNERARNALACQCMVFDRHPIVSERIYGRIRGNVMTDPMHEQAFYVQNNVLIYYRGHEDDLLNHKTKEHDSEQHLKLVFARHATICKEYDRWALERAHLIYRRGESKPHLLELIKGRLT